MDKKTQLFVLATGMLCVPMAWADCNRPSTTYEQQDCNFKSERDFRRGNSEVDQEAQRYLESLRRNEEAEQHRQAEQNRLDRLAAQEREENLRRARAFTQNLDRMEANATALMNARQSDECISVADQIAEVSVTDRRAVALRISGYCHLQNHGNETKGDARYRDQEFALGESKLIAALRATESQYGSQNPRTHDFVLTLWAVYTISQREDEAKAIKQRYGLWTTLDEETFEAKRLAALKNPTPATAPTPPAAAVQNLKTDPEAQKRQADGQRASEEYKAIYRMNELLYLEKFDQVLLACDEAMRLAEKNQQPGLRSLAQQKKAEALIKLNRPTEAEALLTQALASAEKSESAKDQIPNLRESLAKLRESNARASAASTPASAQWTREWQTLNYDAIRHHKSGQFGQAIDTGKQALALAEKNSPPYSDRTIASRLNLVTYLRADKQNDPADSLFQQTLNDAERAPGAAVPQVATILSDIASNHTQKMRYTEAEALYKRALSMLDKQPTVNEGQIADMLKGLASVYRSSKREGEAEQLDQRVKELLAKK